jgi:hypothetical protein
LVAALTLAATGAWAGVTMSREPHPARAFVRLKGVVENETIGPFAVSNVFRVIESDKNVRVRGLRITGVTGTSLQRDGIRVRGDAEGVVIRNFRLAMRSFPQSGPNLPIGIAVQQGRDITISHGEVSGFRMIPLPGKYTNGDGIATERPVQGISITDVRSFNNSDGGFDLKSSRTRLDRLSAEANGRNYRFWRTVDAGTLTSASPRNAHIWLARGADVHIARFAASARTRAPLIRIEGPASIVIDSCQLRLPAGTPLVAGPRSQTRVTLGRGCKT